MSADEKKPRGRPRAFDPERVIDVAMHAYWQDDPNDISLNRLCEMAGVSKPALYREFGSEDGLSRAVLDHYAAEVLSPVFAILKPDTPLPVVLEKLMHFASEDPKMQTGCVFYKMRAGKHRLGPLTREGAEALDTAAETAFRSYLAARQDAGDLAQKHVPDTIARYLVEQIGLALTRRAAGEDAAKTKAVLELALSPLTS
jgi:AcrR family transcriptional regulator